LPPAFLLLCRGEAKPRKERKDAGQTKRAAAGEKEKGVKNEKGWQPLPGGQLALFNALLRLALLSRRLPLRTVLEHDKRVCTPALRLFALGREERMDASVGAQEKPKC
jgi:hypothetical protein